MIHMRVLLVSILLILSACATQGTDTPPFQTSEAAINAAKAKFRQSNDDFLSLLMVNRDGKVVNAKKIASKLDDRAQDYTVLKGMYQAQFTKVPESAPEYREVLFPYRARAGNTDDPSERFIDAYQPGEYITPEDW